ncbi:NAD-dependent succinate-semialdehyde dehydrogenase [Sansalvadorimonas sp. 2012CJ34-2]|uniref:NAD-dependent succinate-semialdehyde dehydrogenase n=1 Tax=Parendozoicomonas callyspongiae TaxID=2942213 RepID=A0ABT0PFY0_9GAMM|nr:NAD-dependent succinate-semialdehyde dehydrogenase [Sansalvadorimonas sp. 2012CJ34-2]MCL6270288.1 NAD-dependent succinate-semialdehyde dehydrogenase [Sansalvadorimonas sp. 2012CJ34-2]
MPCQLKEQSLLQTRAWINSNWIGPGSGQEFSVINPATGKELAQVTDCGRQETHEAVVSAHNALQKWKVLTGKERGSLLRHWYELIMAHQDDLARLMTLEQGKVLAEARGEIAYAASFIEWFSEEAKRIYGDIIPQTRPDHRSLVIKQPIGVVAAITPWNFPAAMITRKAGAALAAGCTIVIKPSEETPLSALALAELSHRAGIPAGVINIVPGLDAQAIGQELCDNPLVKKLTFTGSTAVGKHLLKQSAATVKKVSLELGGNAPIIIFDDADLDKAVAGALACKYRNSGQTCICANRILVQSGIYPAFLQRFRAAVEKLETGDGLDMKTTSGPLINQKAISKVHSLVEDAVQQGASIVTGGNEASFHGCYQPTILTDVNSSMRIAREEIFGPVAPVIQFDSEEDAINLANNTEFGLASYFYTSDLARTWRVSEAIEYGMVGVNETAITSEVIPFGGVKESGIGREGSKYGIDDYLELKYICMGDIR